MNPEHFEAICRAVRAIPRGEVATYGGIAQRAGLPGRARLVGRVLKIAPAKLNLPWHRVLGAGERIVFAPRSREHIEQSRRLRREGVQVLRGRVTARVRPDLDELLWKPARR